MYPRRWQFVACWLPLVLFLLPGSNCLAQGNIAPYGYTGRETYIAFVLFGHAFDSQINHGGGI